MTNAPQSPYSGDRWIISDHKFHQHTSLEAAECELQRLTEKAPGKSFRIYRIKTSLQNDGVFPEMLLALQELRASYFALAEIAGRTVGGTTDVNQWATIKYVDAILAKATVRKDVL